MTAPARFATPADLPALRALIESAYRGETARRGWTHEADLLEGDRTDLVKLSAILLAPDEEILVVEDEAGVLVGSVFIADKGDGLAYLGMLCVAPDRQAAGLGRRLIADAERWAARLYGATVMEMTVIEPRAELVAYYQRRGYVLTGERRPFPFPVAVDFELLVLEKPLA